MSINISFENVQKLFDDIDVERNGEISYNELLGYIQVNKCFL